MASSSTAAASSSASACPHLSAAFTSLNPPRPSQQVHRDECTLCFDDQDGSQGIDVCLICFNGGCTGNGDREHSKLHFQKTGHAIVANVKRTKKPKKVVESKSQAPAKLMIAAETEQDLYEWTTTPKCLACEGSPELPRTDKLDSVIDAMMKSLSSSQQSEVKAWEEEIVPCSHTRELKQLGEAFSLEAGGLAKCGKCDLTSNLWLCLTCGNLGCGRAQFGGVGGNSHGLSHFEETGHPVSVKQGTITAEGTADIYCYACNDARIDPNLAEHLRHFGMNVMDLSKTEKSMTELQLEQNLKFDFNMTGEDGKELEPLFGPGLTGLRNLGNSCYLASTVQSLFAFPAFQARYKEAYRPHTAACPNTLPASCLECQMGKLADGLLSGRYAVSRPSDEASTGSVGALPDVTVNSEAEKQDGPIFQAGIRPSMFKALIGKGHEEFSTMRQQDADEFLKHLVGHLQRESRRLAAEDQAGGAPTNDPTSIFRYGLQQKLQCNECKRVRYTTEAQDAGLSLPVPLRPKKRAVEAMDVDAASSSDVKGKAPAEGTHAPETTTKTSATALGEKIEYEPVSLFECLDLFTAPEELEYHCPSCSKNVIATKQTLFATFPDVLAVQARRFQLVNWVPQKVDVPLVVPLGEAGADLDLSQYLGIGVQPGEEELPQDVESSTAGQSSSNEPEFDVAALSQLTSMGFPEIRCKRALLATGNTGNAEAAMEWLFGHMEDPDIDAPLDFSSSATAPTASNNQPDTSALEEMGFTSNQARKALRLNGNNPEMAVAWLFENADDPGEDASAAASGPSEGEGPSSSASGTAVMGGNADLPAMYRLKTFVSHKGPSVHSGHYVAHVRKPVSLFQAGRDHPSTNGQTEEEKEAWVFFNDEKVVKAPLEAVKEGEQGEEQVDVGVKGLSRLAYVYFFERA